MTLGRGRMKKGRFVCTFICAHASSGQFLSIIWSSICHQSTGNGHVSCCHCFPQLRPVPSDVWVGLFLFLSPLPLALALLLLRREPLLSGRTHSVNKLLLWIYIVKGCIFFLSSFSFQESMGLGWWGYFLWMNVKVWMGFHLNSFWPSASREKLCYKFVIGV